MAIQSRLTDWGSFLTPPSFYKEVNYVKEQTVSQRGTVNNEEQGRTQQRGRLFTLKPDCESIQRGILSQLHPSEALS